MALCLEGEKEKAWASDLKRFVGEQSSVPGAVYRFPVVTENLAAISDRMDGAALLAEALAHEHATGKFHEFMRLFERAFSLPPSKFDRKLTQFLQGAELGYDRPEINAWIDLRNPATHANDPKKPEIVLESDVRPVIARIEQAAYDVLWNKKVWNNPSRERRRFWIAPVATTSPAASLRVTQGLGATFLFQAYDPFKTFVYDHTFTPQLPSHLWTSWQHATTQAQELTAAEVTSANPMPENPGN